MSLKNAEGEDIAYYILYPENAINTSNLKMQNQKNNPNPKIGNLIIDDSLHLTNSSRITIVQNDNC